jgi:hypothetical protein
MLLLLLHWLGVIAVNEGIADEVIAVEVLEFTRQNDPCSSYLMYLSDQFRMKMLRHFAEVM